MLDITLNWKPNPDTLAKLLTLANQQQKTLEALLEEAILQYFQLQEQEVLSVDDDPIVGLYSGSPDLATNAEDILAAEIQPKSGWTNKP
jgi:DNA polymerase III psi subunit